MEKFVCGETAKRLLLTWSSKYFSCLNIKVLNNSCAMNLQNLDVCQPLANVGFSPFAAKDIEMCISEKMRNPPVKNLQISSFVANPILCEDVNSERWV